MGVRRIGAVMAVAAAVLVVLSAVAVRTPTNAMAAEPCPVGKGGVQLTRLPDGSCADTSPPTAEEAKILATKQTAARIHEAFQDGRATAAQSDEAFKHVMEITGESRVARRGGGVSINGYVGVTSKQQINGYYCGPATAQTILWYLGPITSVEYDSVTGGYDSLNGNEYSDQPILANYHWLATDRYGGTYWGSPYMPYTLNRWRGSGWYVGVASPGAEGSLTQSQAGSDINYDTSYGYPVAENTLYSGSSYYPPGFTVGGYYQHWDTVYYYGGGTIAIAQPWPYPGAGSRTAYYSRDWNGHWWAIYYGHGIVW